MSDLSKRIDRLSAEQLDLLMQQLRKKKGNTLQKPLRRLSRETATFPLSFAQQRLWFLEQFDPGTPLYNVPEAFRIEGPLQPEILQQAFAALVARQEILRTTFISHQGAPLQVIHEQMSIEIPVIDLSEMSEHGRLPEAMCIVTNEAHLPFDLVQGPLVRTLLVRLSTNEHLFLLAFHHIIFDGWSGNILLKELMMFYEALLTGSPPNLPPLPVQYADFAAWQREWLQGEVLEQEISYWKRQLDSVPALQLPVDYPRPPVQTHKGAGQTTIVPMPLADALRELGRSEDATLFMILLAAFKALLYHYTGQQDIAIGTVVANRNRAELEGLIGFFVNTLVLRSDLSGDPSFRSILRRVRTVCIGAYAHQDLPFEKLVEVLQLERDLSRTPLFQILLVLQNMPETTLQFSHLLFHALEIDTRTAKFDLALFIGDVPQGLDIEVEYNTDLFDASTITRMLTHLGVLLKAVAAHPDLPLSQLPLLTEEEQSQLLIAWNDTDMVLPPRSCLHQLLEEQVARTPDAIAAVFQEHCLTYSELNARANFLASILRQQGIGPEVLVGLYLERSLELVISLLAVLKAGGAYVPLDPSYPRDRLAFIVQDAGISCLLCEPRLAESLPVPASCNLVYPRQCVPLAEDTPNLSNSIEGYHLAYVIYTSGSTGRPKGVQITHHALLNFMLGISRYCPLAPGDIFCAVTSISFDIAALELFLPLLFGSRLLVVPREVTMAGDQLNRFLAEEGATVMQATPSLWWLLLEAGWQGSSALTMLCGGEALPPELARRLLSQGGELWNLYGPTETTIWSSIYHVRSSDAPILIGQPLPNTQMYLLDARLRPVPVGIPGELYIGGDGLSRGYLGRPELTAERFLPNPFVGTRFSASEPGARFYKTGDLARYKTDGTIEYLGRLDFQVKLRGYRIELGEIEAVLGQFPAVKESVVTVHEDQPGNKRLVAYVVPDSRYEAQLLERMEQQSGSEFVEQWHAVWDETYQHPSSEADPTFNITGWRSSYTGQPIPEEEMREWVNSTVERILSLRPARILEIGCGTGLLLLRLAPHCSHYWGTDFSETALNYLQQQVAAHDLSQVVLLQRRADDFEGIEPQSFDVVILNSVIQYFPSAGYLLQVLQQAIQMVRPGGIIFLGDIRHLGLLRLFQASVQLAQGNSELRLPQLLARAQQQAALERELVIDPDFFVALAQQKLPQISQVLTLLKRGHFHNEMTKFRYDVLLRINSAVRPVSNLIEMDWQRDHPTLPALASILHTREPEAVVITTIPNKRLALERRAWNILTQTKDETLTVASLRKVIELEQDDAGMDPEAFWLLEQEMPYNFYVTWAEQGQSDCFRVICLRCRDQASGMMPEVEALSPLVAPASPRTLANWNTYTNHPLQGSIIRSAKRELRDYLHTKLPDYMVPASFVWLPSLPLTPNGKVNRQALPAPYQERTAQEETLAPPRTHKEQQLAQIWRSVLGIEHLSIHDNFFHLGGDSLMAIRVVSQANQAGLGMTTRQLFQNPTIAALAAVLDTSTLLAEQEPVIGPVPLTPSQCWFLETEHQALHYYTIAFLLEAQETLEKTIVEQTLASLFRYHDALRLRLIRHEADYQLFCSAPDEQKNLCRLIDLAALSDAEQKMAIDTEISWLQQSVNMDVGPLFQGVLFKRGAGKPDAVVLMAHYLSMDLFSWQITLADFAVIYQQLRQGKQAQLPPKSTSVRQWVERLTEYTRSALLQQERSYWLAETRRKISPLPVDFPRGRNTIASSRSVVLRFNHEATRALQHDLPRAYESQTDVLLLACLVQSLARWTGVHTVLIELLGHGREPLFDDMDISRTVGSLNTTFPVVFDIRDTPTMQHIVERVKGQLKSIPNHGIGYGMLRYLSHDDALANALKDFPQPEVYFNYVGTVPGVTQFQVARAFGGHHMDKDGLRSRLLQITALSLSDEHIELEWEYSEHMHQRVSIEQLARYMLEALSGLAATVGLSSAYWENEAVMLSTDAPRSDI